MTRTTYTIESADGAILADGMSCTYAEAAAVAQRLADERGEAVYIDGPGLSDADNDENSGLQFSPRGETL